jgi:hypothetical protein
MAQIDSTLVQTRLEHNDALQEHTAVNWQESLQDAVYRNVCFHKGVHSSLNGEIWITVEVKI